MLKEKERAFLLHGAWGFPIQMRPLARALEAEGIAATCMSLPPPSKGTCIEALAEELAAALPEHPSTRVHLVGFSMGAIVCRYFIQRLGGHERVSRFLSLAAPNHGTATAQLLPEQITGQLRPGSTLLTDLNRDTNPWRGVEVGVFYSPWDPIIRPVESALLPQVTVEASFRVFPHAALLLHRPAIQAATQFIAAGRMPDAFGAT